MQDMRSTTTEGLFAVVAANEALEDCNWRPNNQEQKERAVCNCNFYNLFTHKAVRSSYLV